MNQVADQLGRTKSEGDKKEINKYKEKELTEIIRPKPVDEKTIVFKEGKKFRVEHYQAERIAGMVDLSNWDVKIQFHRHLNQTGVIKELEKQGIEEGDVIRIGEFEFRWGD